MIFDTIVCVETCIAPPPPLHPDTGELVRCVFVIHLEIPINELQYVDPCLTLREAYRIL